MAKVDELLESIDSLTVVELADLVKKIEEKYGVSAAAVSAGPVAGAAAAAEEEPSTVTVHLTAVDASQKIPTIKAVREITGLGLGEAKALCEKLPSVIKENIAVAEAKEIAEKLKAVGATVVMK